MRTAIALGIAFLSIGLAAAPVSAQQKTVRACMDEWRANKTDNQAKGITEKAYVQQCRSGATTAVSTPSPASQRPQATVHSRSTSGSAGPATGNEFVSEAQAKAHCRSDTVVWANLKSKVYHFQSAKSYGNTKSGAYMCERDANSAGMRAAKNEKHPG